jgi:hypothetical protein
MATLCQRIEDSLQIGVNLKKKREFCIIFGVHTRASKMCHNEANLCMGLED